MCTAPRQAASHKRDYAAHASNKGMPLYGAVTDNIDLADAQIRTSLCAALVNNKDRDRRSGTTSCAERAHSDVAMRLAQERKMCTACTKHASLQK